MLCRELLLQYLSSLMTNYAMCSSCSYSIFRPLLSHCSCIQQIWDEVGESDEDRDKMLLQLERDCLDVYRHKVDQALISRTQLLQELADAKSELAGLLAALGERSFIGTVCIYDQVLAYIVLRVVHIFSVYKNLKLLLPSFLASLKIAWICLGCGQGHPCSS